MIAISSSKQSVDKHKQNISVFEEAYCLYFQRFGIHTLVLPSFSECNTLWGLPVDLVILVGGGDAPGEYFDRDIAEQKQDQRNFLEHSLVDNAMEKGIPIIGICRGMQVLNGCFGGRLTRSSESKGEIGKTHKVNTFDGYTLDVNSFHQDVIKKDHMSSMFDVVAMHENGVNVEAMLNIERRILGIQWHPERMTDGDRSKEYTDYLIRQYILNQ